MLYGVMEIGLCYSINNDVDGYGKVEMVGGYYSGSCFGIWGLEDLGNGLKVVFYLVSGFVLDIGVGFINDMGLGGYKLIMFVILCLFGC